MTLMRDAFIDELYDLAKHDRDVIFVSADFGAQALDRFREDLPEQFVHVGIAEQHMVDFAAGLALSGKKVILYAMAPFITLRCLEQVKCVLASMNLPVTLVAVGVGLGYDHATLTHFTPEDIACLRSMNGIEVWSPGDAEGARSMARLVVEDPQFRYIRLERQAMADLYQGSFDDVRERGLFEPMEGSDVAIVACGYMTHKALKAAALLREEGVNAGVVDLFRVKPIDPGALAFLAGSRTILTVEEQLLQGGMGSALLEVLNDNDMHRPLRRLGLKDGFEVVNGTRDQLHARYGIDVPDIVRAGLELARRVP